MPERDVIALARQRCSGRHDLQWCGGIPCPDCIRAVVADLVAEAERRGARTADTAYTERNRCVALIARMALVLGWQAGIRPHEGDLFDEGWNNVVMVDLPTGQVSWHYHDREAHLFADLPAYAGRWDGHDTPEKYRRVDSALPLPGDREEVGRG